MEEEIEESEGRGSAREEEDESLREGQKSDAGNNPHGNEDEEKEGVMGSREATREVMAWEGSSQDNHGS